MSWLGRSSRRKTGRRLVEPLVISSVALLGFTVWLAAPALSLGPYRPEPVEFEMRDATRNGVLRTEKRFNLVGLRWKGARTADLRIRVRLADERWSRWLEIPVDPDHGPNRGTREHDPGWTVSDPLWAGEADQVQYRIAAGRPIRNIRLHFVNTTGSATGLDRLRSGLRRTVAAAVHAAGSVFRADASAQSTSQPGIVTREQWGAKACPPRAAPAYGEVKLAFVHHTVTANEYTPEQSAAMVLGICRYHRNSNRWNDIGYQFIVDKYGKIFEGRAGGIDRAVIGAQAQGYNSQSAGISNLGTFSTTGQTEEGLAALAHLLSWKLALHGVAPQSKVEVRSGGGATNRYAAGSEVTFDAVSGHRDANRTACPGDGLYAQLPRLRGMVTGDARVAAALSLSAERRNIAYGRKARLAGALKAADGSPLAGGPIQIQALGTARGTTKLTSTVTGTAGTFALNLRLVFNRTIQAQFPGNGGVRPALSVPVPIGVRPRVTAALDAAAARRVRVGQRVSVSGSVRPRKRIALLLVDRQRSDGSYARILKRAVPVRLGRVRASRRFKQAGRYRLRLGVDRDARNLSARSAPLEIRVG